MLTIGIVVSSAENLIANTTLTHFQRVTHVW